MAKFYGPIGFAENVKTAPGVWESSIVERKYYGDLLNNVRMLQNSGQINDDINIANKISILADPYAKQNFHAIQYIEFMGTKWKVSNVSVEYPRLILTIGGVYNGKAKG